jgi:hypothetical protein
LRRKKRALRAHEHGAGFLECHGGGLTREKPVLRDARELGMGGELVAARAIHRIARREPRHARSHGLNGAGEIDAQNPVPGSKPSQ